jgi:hypothetical protein
MDLIKSINQEIYVLINNKKTLIKIKYTSSKVESRM